MMEYLQGQRQAAAARIETAENKLACITFQESPKEYDRWTGELLIATREHRRIVVFAKRVQREVELYERIRNPKGMREDEPSRTTKEAARSQGNHSENDARRIHGRDRLRAATNARIGTAIARIGIWIRRRATKEIHSAPVPIERGNEGRA